MIACISKLNRFVELTIFILLSYFLGTPAFAIATEPNNQSQLDSFCPRIEGKTLKGCCPPVFKTTSVQCTYQVVISDQPQLVNLSVVTGCSHDTNGIATPTFTQCCGPGALLLCGDPTKTVKFNYFPRQIYRNNKCEFSSCPTTPDYWITPPPHNSIYNQNIETEYLKLTMNHKLSNIAECNGTPINNCSSTSAVSCGSLTPISCNNLTCTELGIPCPPVPSTSSSSSGSSSSGSSSGGSSPGGSSSSSGGTTPPVPAPTT